MPSVDEDAWSTGEAEDSCLGPLPSPQDGAIPCRREPSVEALDRVAGDRSRQLRVANGIIGEIDVLRVLHEEFHLLVSGSVVSVSRRAIPMSCTWAHRRGTEGGPGAVAVCPPRLPPVVESRRGRGGLQ